MTDNFPVKSANMSAAQASGHRVKVR